MKQCPVCETDLDGKMVAVCPECGFDELDVTFATEEQYQEWRRTHVQPKRDDWYITQMLEFRAMVRKHRMEASKQAALKRKAREKAESAPRQTDAEQDALSIPRVNWQDTEDDGSFRYEPMEGGICITAFGHMNSYGIGMPERNIKSRYFPRRYEATIPNMIAGQKVLGIRGTFNPRTFNKVESVVISKGIETIGDHAFERFWFLEEIALPAGLRIIGYRAFSECKSLREIRLPAGLRTIGDRAFSICEALQKIELPAGVVTVGDGTFAHCGALRDVHLPAGLRTIGKEAFYRCEALQEIELPVGLITIGEGAFENCSALRRIELPAGVKTIGKGAFHGCSSLSEILIPSSVDFIGNGMFDESPVTILCEEGSFAMDYAIKHRLQYAITQ